MLLVMPLAACFQNQPEKIEVLTKPIKPAAPTFEEPDSITMRKVEWKVIDKTNVDVALASTPEGRFYAIDKRSYANQSLNISDMTVLIQQQKAIIDSYKKYLKAMAE